jgi:hypothetical protein
MRDILEFDKEIFLNEKIPGKGRIPILRQKLSINIPIVGMLKGNYRNEVRRVSKFSGSCDFLVTDLKSS